MQICLPMSLCLTPKIVGQCAPLSPPRLGKAYNIQYRGPHLDVLVLILHVIKPTTSFRSDFSMKFKGQIFLKALHLFNFNQ